MAQDSFSNSQPRLDSPAGIIVPVTANDGTDLPNGVCRGLLVGSSGAATVIDASGVQRTAVPLQVGYNPVRVGRIFATGVAASDIWALY